MFGLDSLGTQGELGQLPWSRVRGAGCAVSQQVVPAQDRLLRRASVRVATAGQPPAPARAARRGQVRRRRARRCAAGRRRGCELRPCPPRTRLCPKDARHDGGRGPQRPGSEQHLRSTAPKSRAHDWPTTRPEAPAARRSYAAAATQRADERPLHQSPERPQQVRLSLQPRQGQLRASLGVCTTAHTASDSQLRPCSGATLRRAEHGSQDSDVTLRRTRVRWRKRRDSLASVLCAGCSVDERGRRDRGSGRCSVQA
jgi:hypothetical protein